jgi:uncharacterized RDD family membrane protein YckC
MTESKDKYVPRLCKDALIRIGTPDALLAIRPLERAQAALRLKITVFSSVLIAGFVALFIWSVKLRRQGRNVFHWFIPISVALLVVFAYAWQTASHDVDFDRGEYTFWLVASSIGAVPWFISWFILQRRGSLPLETFTGGGECAADLRLRSGAFFLDVCCTGLIWLVIMIRFYIKGGWSYVHEQCALIIMLMLSVSVIYHAVTAIVWGGGVGKRTAGMRIITADGHKINNKQAFVRALARWLSALPLFVGYLPVFDGKCAWHDRIAGTKVIFDEQTVKTAVNPFNPSD